MNNNGLSKTYCRVRYATYSILAILLAINIRVGWVLFYPYEPLKIQSIKILDTDQVLHPGERMAYEIEFTKYIDISGVVNRSLVDGVIINVPAFTSYMPVGHRTVRDYIDLPAFIDPDKYKLAISFDYEVSSFPKRIVHYRAESNTFEVRK
jgi:hypothetical protein